jgi:hypothetical protein
MTKDELYQEYLEVIRKFKDAFGLTVEVPHRTIHTFFFEKEPIFKLILGTHADTDVSEIVLSFYVGIKPLDAIGWYKKLYNMYPFFQLTYVHIEDDAGETYLGEEAEMIYAVMHEQEILGHWLENADQEEMEIFASAEVYGPRTAIERETPTEVKPEAAAIAAFEGVQPPTDKKRYH